MPQTPRAMIVLSDVGWLGEYPSVGGYLAAATVPLFWPYGHGMVREPDLDSGRP